MEHHRALHAGRRRLPEGHPGDGADPDEAGRRQLRGAVAAPAPLQDGVPVQRRRLGPVPGPRHRPAAGRVPAGGQRLLLDQPHLLPRQPGLPGRLQVTPWRCVRSGGRIVWDASRATIDSQIQDNLDLGRANGIPVVPGVLATGEYSGLRILPQQPADNPDLVAATGPNKIRWIALDASRDPDLRAVGAALGVPRHPIDVGYDVDSSGRGGQRVQLVPHLTAGRRQRAVPGQHHHRLHQAAEPERRLVPASSCRSRSGPCFTTSWATTRGRSSCTSPT